MAEQKADQNGEQNKPDGRDFSFEKKWAAQWEKARLYATDTADLSKPKYYVLDMFPYPSGAGLHVGHPKGYIATDVFSRYKRLQGFNVLHPMGFDAFGLPAENYALKNKVHPRVSTDANIANYINQLKIIGFDYDWERMVNTTDPDYYKWTQWIFLKMFEKGLAYESWEPINWCPSCLTGLANEDLEDGKCERCGSPVEKKPLRQWVLRITDYADRLLDDLEKLPHWEPSIKEMQRNWIGRSEGCEIDFAIEGTEQKIRVFTTRVDTIFGCTYVVLAPEHPLVQELKTQIGNWDEVAAYIEKIKNKSDLERTDLNKDKSGLPLQGISAVNPFNNEKVAVYIADYVLNSYGTGAVMAVPAHDERDFEFANKYKIAVRRSIQPALATDGQVTAGSAGDADTLPFTDDGLTVDSGDFSGLPSAEARAKMADWLKKTKNGSGKVNYKLKDWVFSRQRYWGEPIPIIHCEKCGAVGVPEQDLPVRLPEVEQYEPSGTGESPLAKIEDWVSTVCPQCGGPGRRETNTMPQWAGSSWYYLRYIDPQNDRALVDKKLEQHWSPVDFYVGGAEHATRHLIYARFWHKFLFDMGVVAHDEPFTRLQHVGLIMGEDGRKMSKRWGNVINPDDVVAKYGADALRLYEMFMGPFDQAVNWSTRALIGARRFLDKVENLAPRVQPAVASTTPPAATPEPALPKALLSELHKTIKKVGEDIEGFKFNTAVSQMMILVNALAELPAIPRDVYEKFLLILAPFAPFTAEELWSRIGNKPFIHRQTWPQYDPALLQTDSIAVSVQVNGKLRGVLQVPRQATEEEIIAAAGADANIGKYLADGYKKHIYVPGKILNFVV